MARQYKTGLIITGDASGGIRAIRSTEKELGQLNRGFDQGSRRSKRFAQDLGGSSRELQLLRRVAAPVGAVIAGMFAGQALQNQIRFGDELNKLNLRIGAGAEALSEYRYVAEQAGVQFGTLATAWQRQTRRIAQATTQGTGEAVKALEALNLSARELSQLRPEDQFERIAGALQGVANEGHRTALAMALWDTEGVALLQVVNQGTAAMQQQREEARRLGLTISDETAQAMADYSSELTRLQAVGTGVSRQLLAELVPAMTATLQATSEWIDEMGGAAAILDTTKDAATGVAVVMAGRYTGALATATAAKLAATRQAVLYQAALARMAGVSTTAAASQTALAVATRGAAGALGLIGGPVGAAVIAGGAIYYFREELGLVDGVARQAAGAIEASTSAIRAGSAASLDASYESLINSLEAVSLQAQESMAQLLELEARERFYAKSHEGMADSVRGAIADQNNALAGLWERQVDLQRAIRENRAEREKLTGAERTATDITTELVGATAAQSQASQDAAREVEQHAKALEALRREMNPGRAEAAKFAEQTVTLTKALASGEMGAIEHAQAITHVTQQYLRAATGAEELEKQQKSLVQQYDRHHQKARQLRSDYAQINQMCRAGVIDGDQYARMIANIRDEMNQLAFDADPAAQDMARAWEEASNRIDETFADAFRGAFDSFEDFSDQLLDGFKRLLAELAYQAFLRPIVVSFTGQMGGALGIQGMDAQGGGVAEIGQNLISTGQTLYKGYQWLANGGSTAAVAGQAGTAAVGYGSGWGSQVATGGYSGWAGSAAAGASQAAPGFSGGLPSWAGGGGQVGGWASGVATAGAGFAGGYLGGEVFGKSAEANAGATVGAMVGTYVGSIVPVIGNFLGAAIGSFIGSGIGSLFGSSPTPFSGRFGTREQGAEGFEHMHNVEREGQFFRDSALGRVGFFDQGTERLQRAGTGSKDWADELSAATAEMDNLVASLAQSEDELESMRETVQGLEVSSRNANDIIKFALEERPLAALDQLGGRFGDFVQELEGGIEEVLVKAVVGRDTFELLVASQERLNLVFDSTSDSAYQAALALGDMAGGVENLAAMQGSYYQAYFSEAERAAHLQEDLAQAFAALNMALPESRDQLRELIEAQDLNTAGGRNAYVQLLQLAGGFDQLQTQLEGLSGTVARTAEEIANERYRLETELLRLQGDTSELRARELEQIDESNHALQEYIWALQDHAEATAAWSASQQSAARAAEQAQQEWARAVEAAQREAMNALQSAYHDFISSVDAERQILDDAYSETTQSISDNINTLSRRMGDTERAAASLGNTLTRMLGQVPGSLAMQRAQGQAYIRNVLAGSGLGDADELSRALSAVAQPSEGLFDSFEDYQRDFYRTAHDISALEERASSQLSTDQQALRALEDQLDQADILHRDEMARLDSVLEAQNAALEAQHGQLTWLQTVNGSVLSVAEAIAALDLASSAASRPAPTPPPPSPGSGGSGGGATPPPPPPPPPAMDPEPEPSWTDPALEVLISRGYRSVLGRAPDRAGASYWSEQMASGSWAWQDFAMSLARGAFAHPDRDLEDIKNAASYITANTAGGWDAKDSALALTAIDTGLPSSYLARALGQTQRQVLDRAAELGIPAFASGGYHTGGVRLVGERGPELEVTGPSRIVSNTDTRKMFDLEPLLREVAELRKELRASQRAIAEHTSKSARVLEREEMQRRVEEEVSD